MANLPGIMITIRAQELATPIVLCTEKRPPLRYLVFSTSKGKRTLMRQLKGLEERTELL
jgi:hypothetical protein